MSINIHSFEFSPWSENTYVLHDDSKEAVIIDPGCYDAGERDRIAGYIREQGLKPVLLLNTHCHVDHVFGNRYIKEAYQIPFYMHQADVPVLQAAPQWASMYGFRMDDSPEADKFIDEGDVIEFGNSKLEVLFTPGHAPGHVVFFHRDSRNLIAGDVLFQGSIGRTDLPGGDYDTLMRSIFDKLLPLPEETVVWPGHGPQTTIGAEKRGNPFILDYR